MKARRWIELSILFCLIALLAFNIYPESGVVKAQQPEPTSPGGQQPPAPGPDSNFTKDNFAPDPDAIEPAAVANYQHVSASVFVPLWDTAHAVYAGSGCQYITGTNLFLNYPLVVPNGSVITQIRIYYKDTNAVNGTLWLARYDDGNAYEYLATLNTTGNAGWGTVTQTVNVTIDYANYSYTLVWGSGGIADTTMQFCGYRVAYSPPSIFGVALPTIKK